MVSFKASILLLAFAIIANVNACASVGQSCNGVACCAGGYCQGISGTANTYICFANPVSPVPVSPTTTTTTAAAVPTCKPYGYVGCGSA
ncbi:hypothetical protein HK096_009844, partial [Nowakowskiella sp. JEL0078]